MRLFSAFSLLLVLAACDSEPTVSDLDVGEFRGSFAAEPSFGWVSHDVKGARETAATTFPLRIDFHGNPETNRHAVLTIQVPFDGTVDGADFSVEAGLAAELVWYDGATEAGRETASAGTLGLFRPENQDRDWFRIMGLIDLTFPSGAAVGEFRAVPTGRVPLPECTPTDCTVY